MGKDSQRTRIVAAAILVRAIDSSEGAEPGMQIVDVVISAPPPARHHNLLHTVLAIGHRRGANCQGFLLSDGSFADRRTAWDVAEAASQLLSRAPTGSHGTLFSEDLW